MLDLTLGARFNISIGDKYENERSYGLISCFEKSTINL